MNISLDQFVRGSLVLELETVDGRVVKLDIGDMRSLGGKVDIDAKYDDSPLSEIKVSKAPEYYLTAVIAARLAPYGENGAVAVYRMVTE